MEWRTLLSGRYSSLTKVMPSLKIFDKCSKYFVVEVKLPKCKAPSAIPSFAPVAGDLLSPSNIPTINPSQTPGTRPTIVTSIPSIGPSTVPSGSPSLPILNPFVTMILSHQ